MVGKWIIIIIIILINDIFYQKMSQKEQNDKKKKKEKKKILLVISPRDWPWTDWQEFCAPPTPLAKVKEIFSGSEPSH